MSPTVCRVRSRRSTGRSSSRWSPASAFSAIQPLNTYKVGFGYKTERRYTPFAEFPYITDPQHFANHVLIKYRADQPGVRRINDFDEYGEAYNDPHSEKTNYGQPIVFHKNGDPEAYLHKSLPGTVDGNIWPAPFQEAFADQTSALGLLTFTAQGDLPRRWTVTGPWRPRIGALRRAHRRRAACVGGLVAGLLRRRCEADDAAVPGHQQPGAGQHPRDQPAAADDHGSGATNTITREITTVQTVAGPTVVKQVSAKQAKSARKSCMKKANAKKSAKAKKRAMKRCRRL